MSLFSPVATFKRANRLSGMRMPAATARFHLLTAQQIIELTTIFRSAGPLSQGESLFDLRCRASTITLLLSASSAAASRLPAYSRRRAPRRQGAPMIA